MVQKNFTSEKKKQKKQLHSSKYPASKINTIEKTSYPQKLKHCHPSKNAPLSSKKPPLLCILRVFIYTNYQPQNPNENLLNHLRSSIL
jgi:hypothetical protein